MQGISGSDLLRRGDVSVIHATQWPMYRCSRNAGLRDMSCVQWQYMANRYEHVCLRR
jgi:hypothetical protein